MTISTQNRTAGPFAGNDATTAFPFNFKVFASKDVMVVRTEALTSISTNLTLATDYTVTLNGDQNANPGGTVTLLNPLAAGFLLVLTSQLEYLQPLELTNQGGFYPKVINAAFDRLTILIQQLYVIASRSLRFPVSDTGTNTELPQRTTRANSLLGFDGSGNPVAVGMSFAPERPVQREMQIATEGQSLFTLKQISYTPGIGSLAVYLDGFRLYGDYVETGRTTVTVTRALPDGAELLFEAGSGVNSQTVNDAAMIPFGSTNVAAQLRGDNVPEPAVRGFWTDEGAGANIHRWRDRVLIGDAVKHTGRRTPPYGNTWLAESVATWPEKNAQAVILSSEGRIGLLGGSHVGDGSSITGSCIGIAGFTYNGGVNSTARAFYADATLAGPDAAAVYGLEIAVSNRGADVQANAYNFSALKGVVLGMHLTPEGGSGYTLGDADTPAPVSLFPATCAINIGAGSGGTPNKRWNLGIRFGSTALTTDANGNAVAVSMAQGHTLEWMASSAIYGARIRSKVTAIAGQDMGIQFDNNLVSVRGTDMVATIADFAPVASGVNNVRFINAAVGGFPSIASVGTDANIGMFFDAKGAGNHRFRTNGGIEQFRVSHTASAVNFISATGGIAGGTPRVDALGADANIDIAVTPKGTGNTVVATGNLRIVQAGSGLRVKEGANAKQGIAVLVAGSVVVANTSVTATSRIFLTGNADGGAPGWLRVSSRVVGASFTIASGSGTDTSTVAWQIFEPA